MRDDLHTKKHFRSGNRKKGLTALPHFSSFLMIASWDPLNPELSGLQNDPLLLRMKFNCTTCTMGNKGYLGSDLQVNENKEIICVKILWKNLENSHQEFTLWFKNLCLAIKHTLKVIRDWN